MIDLVKDKYSKYKNQIILQKHLIYLQYILYI